jgi:1-deoxy-D-xylulose-5-phosphate reductoisomerase
MEPGRFPCFELAVSAGKKGGTYPAALSAADEVAVQAFLDSKIGFTDIHKIIDRVLTEHESLPGDKAEDFLEADRWATGRATELTGE